MSDSNSPTACEEMDLTIGKHALIMNTVLAAGRLRHSFQIIKHGISSFSVVNSSGGPRVGVMMSKWVCKHVGLSVSDQCSLVSERAYDFL